ncbi:MAG: chemotaxis protein CheW [Planctomycetota bacterium]
MSKDKCIGFMVNGSEYTVPITKVQEIINVPYLTKLPLVPHYIEGITNVRGKIILIVNLNKLVGLYGGIGKTPSQKILIVTGDRITFGVLVDGITGVITLDETEREPSETAMKFPIKPGAGVAKMANKSTVLLNTQKLIPGKDVSLFEDEGFGC